MAVQCQARQVELPYTKLPLCISHKFFHMPSMRGYDYPGVLPDYWVPQTLADYRAGRDTVLEFVADMVGHK